MSNGNYGQVAINAEILAEERLEREFASRQPGALEALAEEVERLRRELGELKRRPSFDGTAFGHEIVDAVKGYVDRTVDAVHNRIDESERRMRLAIEESVMELHTKCAGLEIETDKLKAGKVRVRLAAPTRPQNGIGKAVQ